MRFYIINIKNFKKFDFLIYIKEILFSILIDVLFNWCKFFFIYFKLYDVVC